MNLLNGFLSLVFLTCSVILLYLFLLPTSIQTNSMRFHTNKCIPHHVNKKLRCYSNEEIDNSVRINQTYHHLYNPCYLLVFIATRNFYFE